MQPDNLERVQELQNERSESGQPAQGKRQALAKFGDGARALLKAPFGELSATQFPPLAAEIEQLRPRPSSWFVRHYKSILFVLVTVLPTCAAIVYYCFIATPQYVTEFFLGIGIADPTIATIAPQGGGGTAGTLLGGSTLGETVVGLDSYVVTQYIQSREMADLLNKQIGLRKLFSDRKADFLSRLNPKATEEEFTAYWQNMVYAYFDLTTGAIDVQIRGFTPTDSLNIANAVIKNASQRISDMRDQQRADELRSAQNDVANAEKRVIEKRAELHALRDKENIYDPTERVTAVSTTADKLRDDIAGMEAQERAFASYMAPDSPVLSVLKSRIAGTKTQLKAVEGEITSKTGGENLLASVVNRFNEVNAEESFAEGAYQSALQALELARNTANREQIFLVNYVKPSLPQMSLYPNTIKSIAFVAIFALIAWLLLAIVIQSVRDHIL